MTLLAPRIGNDVSYVTQITDDIDFVWQAQYLVRLGGASCNSAHCQRSTGVLRGKYWVGQSSTGVVLRSTEYYWSSTL